MSVIQLPFWRNVGEDWHLIVGNTTVARLVPNKAGRINRLSLVDEEFDLRWPDSVSWHAVDFETLEVAQYDIMQWWLHWCRGENFHTR